MWKVVHKTDYGKELFLYKKAAISPAHEEIAAL